MRYPTLRRFLFCLLITTLALIARANDASIIAAVRAADDERTAAIIAADSTRLDAILMDELRYSHSNGKIDTKASYMTTMLSRRRTYESFDYAERDFKLAGPGVVLMTGRVLVHSSSEGQKMVLDLNFLAVWREDHGRWRFLAWQSCRNEPPVAM